MTYFSLSRGTCISLAKEDIKAALGPAGLTFFRTRLRGKSFYHKKFHEKKLIFIHVPKSAGTSIGESLFGSGETGHFEWFYYKQEDPAAFDEYFKFAFVRDPVSRFLSAYNYLLDGGKSETDRSAGADIQKYKDINDFVENAFLQDGWRKWVHFRTQSSFLFEGSEQRVDFIGRTESFDEDTARLSNEVGRQINTRRSNAGASRRYSRRDISEKSMHVLLDFYAVDYDNLGYSPSL